MCSPEADAKYETEHQIMGLLVSYLSVIITYTSLSLLLSDVMRDFYSSFFLGL